MIPRRKPITPEAAKLRMADLCARSEQCEHDVCQKLLRMGFPLNVASGILEELKAGKFIDNSRYAVSFTRDKCRFSSWGPYKIRLALAAKHVSQSDISVGLAALEPEEIVEAARRVAKSKSRSLSLHGPDSKTERMKLYRHLLSRGFDSRMASEVTKEVIISSSPGHDE